MTIAEVRGKCKAALARLCARRSAVPRDVRIVILLILVALLSFGLGYLAGRDAGQGTSVTLSAAPAVATSSEGAVVASKNGTKYYLPWCAGADRIASANKVWFTSSAAAQAQGYAPAANCAGL